MSQLNYKTIVVPVDFSEASENAIKVAVEMAGETSQVHVVHVLPPLEAISPAVVWGDVTDLKRIESVKEYAAKFLLEHGAAGAKTEVRLGSPGYEVTEYADEIQADLIIISSHGYHGLKRMLLGSVAEVVIRHAHCAVLVLRRQDAE